jgi:hypothetical protein
MIGIEFCSRLIHDPKHTDSQNWIPLETAAFWIGCRRLPTVSKNLLCHRFRALIDLSVWTKHVACASSGPTTRRPSPARPLEATPPARIANPPAANGRATAPITRCHAFAAPRPERGRCRVISDTAGAPVAVGGDPASAAASTSPPAAAASARARAAPLGPHARTRRRCALHHQLPSVRRRARGGSVAER